MLNLPNILTLSRIAAIPVVVACFWLDRGWAQWFSMIVFVAACVTDWFDGYFARRYHQISRFGRFLDPIADKLLVAAALLMLVDRGPPFDLSAMMAHRLAEFGFEFAEPLPDRGEPVFQHPLAALARELADAE